MMPETAQAPDAASIRADLIFMTRRWHELPEPAMIEIRAFDEFGSPQIGRFKPDWIDGDIGAVQWIADMNRRGRNCYAVRNPVRDTVAGKGANDADIIAAFYLWADCDEGPAAENVLRFPGPKWVAAVTTGRVPSTRVHTYWELQEPCRDLAAWRDMQSAIARHFGSDPSVINPSRIMRIGGTVSWPAKHKRERGYVEELTAIRTEYQETREPVTMDQMARAFASSIPAVTPPRPSGTGFQIDTGSFAISLDRERLAIQAMSGMDWHNAVIRLVASYVGKGLSDTEIHALTQPLTLAGYTGEQTAREVQTAIDGARKKGWTPEPTSEFTPNFDHAPAPTASDPTPQAPGWKVQTASDFTADFVAPEYIIDGIIQRGRIYTLTAPTGSGKTAAMLYASVAIATGMQFCCNEVEVGDVIFMAGENPDDVRARVIATMEFYGINPANCRLHFIAGTFSIRADMEKLRQEMSLLPDLKLVIIDTFAAYFDGDDENSNAQALDFARLVRRIAAFPAKPAVIMPAHPVKNATRSNLTPKGGSSLLNEVDGNLTLWNDGGMLSLHWQGKFRGAEFEPMSMELQRYESSLICDHQGRIMPTILAKPILVTRAIQIARDNLKLEDKLLFSIRDYPAISLEQRGTDAGGVHKQKVARTLLKMAEQKLVRRFRTNWELTKEGERAIGIIENGDGFVPEIDG